MTEKPNILWICTDQQRYDTIGALGNDFVETPNIDGLVADGVTYTHAVPIAHMLQVGLPFSQVCIPVLCI